MDKKLNGKTYAPTATHYDGRIRRGAAPKTAQQVEACGAVKGPNGRPVPHVLERRRGSKNYHCIHCGRRADAPDLARGPNGVILGIRVEPDDPDAIDLWV